MKKALVRSPNIAYETRNSASREGTSAEMAILCACVWKNAKLTVARIAQRYLDRRELPFVAEPPLGESPERGSYLPQTVI